MSVVTIECVYDSWIFWYTHIFFVVQLPSVGLAKARLNNSVQEHPHCALHVQRRVIIARVNFFFGGGGGGGDYIVFTIVIFKFESPLGTYCCSACSLYSLLTPVAQASVLLLHTHQQVSVHNHGCDIDKILCRRH